MPFLVLLLILLISTPCFSQTLNESPDQIWQVGDRRWTVEEERRFEKWVNETMEEDFFVRYKIPTDCADAVYAIRWIYARIEHLPAAATTRDGKRIGHWSTEWKHLPTHPDWDKDERFRAALLYLLPKTWTGTLPFDTYPVRISADSVTPGTVFLVTESHTGIVGHVFPDGSHAHPLLTWESALPVKVQKLSLRYFFSGKPDSKGRSGFVKFRWPVSENGEWKYLPVEEHPFYSEEQYSSRFCEGSADFVETVARKIDPNHHAPMEKIGKVMGTTIRLLRERIPIVLAGYRQCRNGGCPEASELWEIHNTVGRDGMIISLMDHLSQLIELNHLDQEGAKRMMEAISIDISEVNSVTLYHVYQNHLWLSPHPGDSIEARWGLKKCETIQAQTRTTNASIAFIEKTYRRKDPYYADFTIRTQQQLLARLNEEWTKSECKEPSPAPEQKILSSAHREDSIKTRRESIKAAEKKASLSLPPRISKEVRLQLKKCERISAEIRATKDSIAFIETTYRKKDPDYADFTIQTQQQLLEKLNEEWVGSECK